ncbi:MAG: signal peptidase I [Ruminococcus sp.]|nr:signal peptidase I [Ruminococcus sp.]
MNSDEIIQEESTPEEEVSTLRKRLSFAGNAAIAIVTAVLVGFVAYVMVCTAKGKPVSVFGRSLLKVVTGSMEPSLHTGDYIYIKKVPADELSAGDVITFRSEEDDVRGKLVTHRIISIEPDGTFITKGDANHTPDHKHIRADQIVGKFTGKARFYRWIGSFADHRKLILMAVMILMSAAAIYEVRTISRITAEAARKKEEAAEEEREALIREAIEKEKERLAQAALSEEELLKLKEQAEKPPAAEEAVPAEGEDEAPAEVEAAEEEVLDEGEDEAPAEVEAAVEEVPASDDAEAADEGVVEVPAEEAKPEVKAQLPKPSGNKGNNSGSRTNNRKKHKKRRGKR